VTQEDYGIRNSGTQWGRGSTPQRSQARTPNPGLLDPLLRLKHESWHKRSAHPFRAGLATTSWQLAQAHSLSGKRFASLHDDTLVVMALTNKPGAHLGWALAALTLQRKPGFSSEQGKTDGLVTVTDISFSATAPQERRELLTALVDAAREAAGEAWQVCEIELSDAVMAQHAKWLDQVKIVDFSQV